MKEWTKEEIKKLVETNDTMLCRSLVKLYECQTADEQRSKETKEHNGEGFNALDAEIMSSIAEFYIDRGYITEKQKAVVRRKIMKYVSQITRLANIHEEAKVAVC